MTQAEIRLEETACNLCGSEETEILRTARVRHYGKGMSFELVRCKNCSLVFLSPRPAEDRIREFYPLSYQADIKELIKAGQDSWIFRAGLKALRKRRLPPPPADGRLLDIGCSNGRYLAAAQEEGWHTRGIEMDVAAAAAARECGLDVDQGDAETILRSYAESSYDLVTMWHVLEHLFDPAAVLDEIRRVLKPGGTLMLDVPNFASPLAAAFGDSWFPLEPPRHLYHYTPETLRALITRHGLEIRGLRGVPSPEAVAWSLESLFHGPTDTHERGPVTANFLLMGLLFPPSWLLAKFNRSDSMAAVAVKPTSTR